VRDHGTKEHAVGESKTAIVAAVGDFLIDRRAKAPDIARVRTMLGGVNMAISNVDTVLSDLGQPSPKYANLRGPRESVHDLREMGFDVVTLANNHACPPECADGGGGAAVASDPATADGGGHGFGGSTHLARSSWTSAARIFASSSRSMGRFTTNRS
jgi:hypothetical protein